MRAGDGRGGRDVGGGQAGAGHRLHGHRGFVSRGFSRRGSRGCVGRRGDQISGAGQWQDEQGGRGEAGRCGEGVRSRARVRRRRKLEAEGHPREARRRGLPDSRVVGRPRGHGRRGPVPRGGAPGRTGGGG